MCKNVFSVFALLFSIVPNIANAQVISLVCNGSMHTYSPGHIEAAISADSVLIDLDRRTISSSFGSFRIERVDERTVVINERNSQLELWGSIDRFTGVMTVMWFLPQEAAKISAGLQGKVERQVDLRCIPSRRLF